MLRTALLAPLVLLAACGQSDADPGPGGVTVGEAKALDEAAEMIEQRRLPPEAAESPGDEGTGDNAGEASPAQGE